MQLKRFLSLLASAAMALTALTGSITALASTVASGKCGENVTWTLDSDGVLTISGTGPMYFNTETGNLQTYESWEYSEYANQINEVVIEEGVTTVGPCAFGRVAKSTVATDDVAYPKLKKISLPLTIEKIQKGAFLATVIENLTIPENVKQIDSQAYQYSLIENVTIPEGVIVYANAFGNCQAIKEVTLGADINYKHGAGWGDEDHTESIFNNCTALEKVTVLGAGLVTQRFEDVPKGLPNTMCMGCTSLTEVIFKCSDLQYIGNVNKTGYNTETFPTNGTSPDQYSNKITYYIYEGSETEQTLRNAGYIKNSEGNYVYILNTSELEAVIAKAEAAIATRLYTDESVATLEKAVKKGNDILNNPASAKKDVDQAVRSINNALAALVLRPDGPKPPDEPSEPSSSEPSSDNSDPSSEPSSDSSKPKTDPTTSPTKAPSTKATRSPAQVTKDKNNAQKTMNQAKITSLKAKAKGKKKIVVSWKKVTKAVGYEVQVAKNNKFKKAIVDTFTNNVKLTIADKKIKSKKTYFVRVRAYSTYKDANNKPQKVYSKWIKKVRKVKVK